MPSWREQKRAAMDRIHATFEVPAVYLTHTAGTPVRTTVRVHIKPVVSNIEGGEFADTAQMLDMADTVIIPAAAVPRPLTDAYVIVSASEVYRLATVRPPREGYVVCEVVAMKVADIELLLAAVPLTDVSVWQGILP